ncbi:MAG: lactate utilization protein [Oscillospiraceae bacterium]|nr:lactate utilization protein [Oscillospiraceae bacterium]
MQKKYYDKRGATLVKNLENRHFEAYYCSTKEEALEKALSLIPAGSSVSWGGTVTCQQIGLMDAIKTGDYRAVDRDKAKNFEEREELLRQCLLTDTFLTGANAISMDGQMVNIDGTGNRLAAICFGPKQVVVVAGMNKVTDTLESAIQRARSVASPMNEQRFDFPTPCNVTGVCADCKSEKCICNHILVTRHSRGNRIKFILVGEDLGF